MLLAVLKFLATLEPEDPPDSSDFLLVQFCNPELIAALVDFSSESVLVNSVTFLLDQFAKSSFSSDEVTSLLLTKLAGPRSTQLTTLSVIESLLHTLPTLTAVVDDLVANVYADPDVRAKAFQILVRSRRVTARAVDRARFLLVNQPLPPAALVDALLRLPPDLRQPFTAFVDCALDRILQLPPLDFTRAWQLVGPLLRPFADLIPNLGALVEVAADHLSPGLASFYRLWDTIASHPTLLANDFPKNDLEKLDLTVANMSPVRKAVFTKVEQRKRPSVSQQRVDFIIGQMETNDTTEIFTGAQDMPTTMEGSDDIMQSMSMAGSDSEDGDGFRSTSSLRSMTGTGGRIHPRRRTQSAVTISDDDIIVPRELDSLLE
jgi:hypothetical protein